MVRPEDEDGGCLEGIGNSDEERFPLIVPKSMSGPTGLDLKNWRVAARKVMSPPCSFGSLGSKLEAS